MIRATFRATAAIASYITPPTGPIESSADLEQCFLESCVSAGHAGVAAVDGGLSQGIRHDDLIVGCEWRLIVVAAIQSSII